MTEKIYRPEDEELLKNAQQAIAQLIIACSVEGNAVWQTSQRHDAVVHGRKWLASYNKRVPQKEAQ
jgi:hypothetical protein